MIRNPSEAVCFIPLHLQVFFQAKEISAFEGAHLALFGPLIDFQGGEHTDHHHQQFDGDAIQSWRLNAPDRRAVGLACLVVSATSDPPPNAHAISSYSIELPATVAELLLPA
jgi:hypothetical protein